jgi:hypothetical protein
LLAHGHGKKVVQSALNQNTPDKHALGEAPPPHSVSEGTICLNERDAARLYLAGVFMGETKCSN